MKSLKQTIAGIIFAATALTTVSVQANKIENKKLIGAMMAATALTTVSVQADKIENKKLIDAMMIVVMIGGTYLNLKYANCKCIKKVKDGCANLVTL